MNTDNVPPVTPSVLEEAKRSPNGHVFAIEGVYGPEEAVPPEAIVGAWEVDASAQITGEFIRNPRYRPGRR